MESVDIIPRGEEKRGQSRSQGLVDERLVQSIHPILILPVKPTYRYLYQ